MMEKERKFLSLIDDRYKKEFQLLLKEATAKYGLRKEFSKNNSVFFYKGEIPLLEIGIFKKNQQQKLRLVLTYPLVSITTSVNAIFCIRKIFPILIYICYNAIKSGSSKRFIKLVSFSLAKNALGKIRGTTSLQKVMNYADNFIRDWVQQNVRV